MKYKTKIYIAAKLHVNINTIFCLIHKLEEEMKY